MPQCAPSQLLSSSYCSAPAHLLSSSCWPANVNFAPRCVLASPIRALASAHCCSSPTPAFSAFQVWLSSPVLPRKCRHLQSAVVFCNSHWSANRLSFSICTRPLHSSRGPDHHKTNNENRCRSVFLVVGFSAVPDDCLVDIFQPPGFFSVEWWARVLPCSPNARRFRVSLTTLHVQCHVSVRIVVFGLDAIL